MAARQRSRRAQQRAAGESGDTELLNHAAVTRMRADLREQRDVAVDKAADSLEAVLTVC